MEQKLSSEESANAQLATQIDASKKKLADLEKKLLDSRNAAAYTEKELTQKIQDLQKTVANDKEHDAVETKALEAAQEAAKIDQAAKHELQKKLDATESELVDAKSQLTALNKLNTDSSAKIIELNVELDAEQNENNLLKATVADLKVQISDLEKNITSLKNSVARDQTDLAEVRKDLDVKNQTINTLEAGNKDLSKDRDIWKAKYTNLKAKLMKDMDDN